VTCDARIFLEAVLPRTPFTRRPAWLERIAELRERKPMPRAAAGAQQRTACDILRHLGAVIEPDTVITTDVGQHQMWVAQHLPIRRSQRLLTSGGLGSMGFGLPAAIGAALVSKARVLCISGDGSLLLNIHELATLAELDLDVTILVFDNQQLGLVRQQQVLFYEQRICAASYERPTDLVLVARAFGIRAQGWDAAQDTWSKLDAWLMQRGPQLISVPLSAAAMVLPMVPPGAANHEMLEASE
jgi:acetolactate synthase-1/2/3 large subunit